MSRLTDIRKTMASRNHYKTRVTTLIFNNDRNHTPIKEPNPFRALAAAILYQALIDDARYWYTDHVHRYMDKDLYDIYSGILGIPYTYEELLDIFVQNNDVENPDIEKLLIGW